MAFVTNFVCRTCEAQVHEVVHPSSACASCRQKEASRKKRTHLASLKGLTVEERLERIEEILYDLDVERVKGFIDAATIRY